MAMTTQSTPQNELLTFAKAMLRHALADLEAPTPKTLTAEGMADRAYKAICTVNSMQIEEVMRAKAEAAAAKLRGTPNTKGPSEPEPQGGPGCDVPGPGAS